MTAETQIRESGADDIEDIVRLYPDAFPGEDLVPLVRQLLAGEPAVLSLVAVSDASLAGHVIFTECGVAGAARQVALLGPLAVAPARQKRGIGSKLVREGFERLSRRGISLVCVLGDPAYYGRFGFRPETGIETPCPIPEDWRGAWQSVALGSEEPAVGGRLTVPQAWMQPELWAP